MNKTAKSSSKSLMDDLLKKYGSNISSLSRGDEVEGVIIRKTKKQVIVDIDQKHEGLIAEKAYAEAKDYIKTLKVGDKIKANVVVPETPDGYVILSFRKTMNESAWNKIEKAYKKDKPVKVVGKNVVGAGVTVDIFGLFGFIPNSLLGKEAGKSPKSLINKKFDVKVVEFDRNEKKIVLSEQAVSDATELRLIKKAMKKIKKDEVYEGEITNITNFGMFVRLNLKVGKETVDIEGLVHVSEVSWEKTEDLFSSYKVGDRVKVKTDFGEVVVFARVGDVPEGVVFIPMGPYANRVISDDTDGTGMPRFKGVRGVIEKTDESVKSIKELLGVE